jgi:hypothetical protein
MPLRFNKLRSFKANLTQLLSRELSRTLNIVGVFRQRTDTRDAQPVFEFFEEATLVCANIGLQWGHGHKILSRKTSSVSILTGTNNTRKRYHSIQGDFPWT